MSRNELISSSMKIACSILAKRKMKKKWAFLLHVFYNKAYLRLVMILTLTHKTYSGTITTF